MPFFEVSHYCDLTDAQQDQLAERITTIHAEKFDTPRAFVNIAFRPATTTDYCAGRRVKVNQIRGFFRTGPSRNKEDFDFVSQQISKAWEEVIGTKGEHKLSAVFLVGGLVSVFEHGFVFPGAGGEDTWIKDNIGKFQQLADGGDETFKSLLGELHSRDAFKHLVNGS